MLFFTTSPSRFDIVPSMRTIRVSSRVKSLQRTLQRTLRPASRQFWIATSLGQSLPTEVIIARIESVVDIVGIGNPVLAVYRFPDESCDMVTEQIFHGALVWAVFAMAVLTFASLLRLKAPYGRHYSGRGWGPEMLILQVVGDERRQIRRRLPQQGESRGDRLLGVRVRLPAEVRLHRRGIGGVRFRLGDARRAHQIVVVDEPGVGVAIDGAAQRQRARHERQVERQTGVAAGTPPCARPNRSPRTSSVWCSMSGRRGR